MNRDDIIRMAGHRDVPPWVLKLVMDCVEAEREACAKVWRTTMNRDDTIRMAQEAGYGEAMVDLHLPALIRFAALVAAAEREACAALCDGIAERNEADHDGEWACGNWECAAAIRARTNQGE